MVGWLGDWLVGWMIDCLVRWVGEWLVGWVTDHVHDDAEGIEHVITPEIEKELEELLDFPSVDPHNKEIPY